MYFKTPFKKFNLLEFYLFKFISLNFPRHTYQGKWNIYWDKNDWFNFKIKIQIDFFITQSI